MAGFRLRWSSLAVPIRTRLTIWNMVTLALVLVALGAALLFITSLSSTAMMDNSLIDSAYTLRSRQEALMAHAPRHDAPGPLPLTEAPGGPPADARRRDPINNVIGSFGEPQPRILGRDGRPLPPLGFPAVLPGEVDGVGQDGPWDRDAFQTALRGQETITTVHLAGEAMRVASVPIRQKGQVVGVVQTAVLLAELDRDRQSLIHALLMLLPIALAVTGLTGWALTSRALRPVGQIASTAASIGAESLTERLPVQGRDEFSQLAGTFNGMLDRLENAFGRLELAYQQQKRFTADASHELRSPLAVIKAHTSLMLSEEHTAGEYRQSLEVTDRAVDRTSRIVQDLLLLARADSGQYRPTLLPTSLRSILEQALEAVRLPGNPPAYLRLVGDQIVRGNLDALVRLFSNLLTNAARHTPSEGRITVSVKAQEDSAHVSITDTGEGIAPEHLTHLFERFYRADASRAREDGGTGLGLAICRSIAQAHDGEIEIESELCVGTLVHVRLPLANRRGC